MTHAGGGDAWADETTFHPVGSDGVAAAAIAAVRAMEATIEASGLDWLVLRGGLFYGPGTGFDDDWFGRARAGKLRLPAEGRDYVSLVHITDMAAATVAALAKWPSRQALIDGLTGTTITATSTEGAGSALTIRLPLPS